MIYFKAYANEDNTHLMIACGHKGAVTQYLPFHVLPKDDPMKMAFNLSGPVLHDLAENPEITIYSALSPEKFDHDCLHRLVLSVAMDVSYLPDDLDGLSLGGI